MNFVRVAVNLPAVSGEFDYHLPPGLDGQVAAGHLVLVPFGAQIVQGIVLQVISQAGVSKTKPVQELLDPAPVLTPAQIEVARQLAAHSLNPLAAILDLMLPPGLSQHADVLYSLAPRWLKADTSDLPPVQKRLVGLLQSRGPLRGRQIDRHFQRVEWRKPAQALIRQAVLERQSVLPAPSVRPKYILTAQLAVTPEQAEAAMPTLGKTPATLERRQQALRFLVTEPDAVAVAWVYAQSGCNLADLQELAERELIILLENEIFRDPLDNFNRGAAANLPQAKTSLTLTVEQQSALAAITQAMQSGAPSRSFLLYGVTGSGKTEVYLRATAEAIRQGKSAIILVPEIAITPQIVRRFVSHFPGQVGLVHSKLSAGERYDTWRRARSGKLKVIIGPRSALFSPLPNLGLIVVDECHDNSYYQSEPPFYHALKAAEMVAQVNGAVCIFGSATPSVELRYRSLLPENRPDQNGLVSLELPRRFQMAEDGGGPGGLPPVSIIDMRDELKTGNRGIFSRMLQEALAETLERGEQAILYLNRRGTATYVFCRTCGYVVKCPRCDTPMTQHDPSSPDLPVMPRTGLPGNLPGLVCHRCGYARQMPRTCPNCQHDQIRAFGLGSEKVEKELKTILPKARALRWDWETTRGKDAHEMILTHFANHQADVLVGTQMLAKGLDLPLVTLVGVVLADVGLALPDPFAAERTFQLLTQVAGRAGRSARGGRVVMQSFMPGNPVIQFASRHDYEGFYHWEIDNRRKLGYPPFEQLMRLEYRHRDNVEAEAQARWLAESIARTIAEEQRSQTNIIGPAPSFFARLNGLYRWQLLVRGPKPASLLHGHVPEGWRVEVEPVSLL